MRSEGGRAICRNHQRDLGTTTTGADDPVLPAEVTEMQARGSVSLVAGSPARAMNCPGGSEREPNSQ
jgi:hypothetical protein